MSALIFEVNKELNRRGIDALYSSRDLASTIESGLRHGFETAREQHRAELEARDEVMK